MNNPTNKPVAGDSGSQRQGTSFIAVLKSVMAAAFGVQSSANRKRDFEHGKPLHFIVGGLIFTLLFILALVLLVQLILP